MDNSKALQDSLAGIENKLAAIESQLEATRGQIESRLDALEKGHLDEGETAPSSAGVTLSRINEAMGRMAGAESQSQVLAAYLEEALAMASRGILFLKEGEQYSQWQSIGFDSAQVEPISTQDQSSPIIRAATNKQVVVSGENLEETISWLSESGESPRVSLCIPLVFGDTVPVVLYLDSSDEVPVHSLELLTQLAVLILKNQYLQQLTALKSSQGGEVVAEEIESPEPLQFGQEEEKPVAEKTEEPAAVTGDEPNELMAEEPTRQLAGTSSEEETHSPEGVEDDPQSEPDTLRQEETEADSEQTVPLPNYTAPEGPAADSEQTVPLPNYTPPEGPAADPEQTVILPNYTPPEEEAADPEPVPEPPGFSYKKVPARGEEIPTLSEDGESD